MALEIQDYPPILAGKESSMPVISESKSGVQIAIVYEEYVGIRRPIVKQFSIARHLKWQDAETFTYRWFETYLDDENKVQIAEWEAIYRYNSKNTVRFVDAKRKRGLVTMKEIYQANKAA